MNRNIIPYINVTVKFAVSIHFQDAISISIIISLTGRDSTEIDTVGPSVAMAYAPLHLNPPVIDYHQ